MLFSYDKHVVLLYFKYLINSVLLEKMTFFRWNKIINFSYVMHFSGPFQMMGLITNLTTILMVSWEIYFQHRHAYDPNSERSLMNTAAVTFFILVQLVSHVMSWTIIYLYIAEWTFLCLGFNILVTWLATKRAMANDSNDDKIKK